MDEIGNMVFYNSKMAEADDKDAILVMSFGTVSSSAMKRSLEAIAFDIKEAFPDKKVQMSVSSRQMVKRIYAVTGKVYQTHEEALELLKNEKYTRVVMLPLDIIPGNDYDYERDLFCMEHKKFKLLAIGTPLMYWIGADEKPDDVSEFFEVVRSSLPTFAEDEAVLLMGHGTVHWANDYYWFLQEKIERAGIKNIFVYTLKSSPNIEDMVHKLRRSGFYKALLVPLLMTAGKHVVDDMYGNQPHSHRFILETAGIGVRAWMHGLGESDMMRKLIVKRARALCNHVF